jgi:hypothetical protein
MSRGRFDEDDSDDNRKKDRTPDRSDARPLTPEAILGWGAARAGLGANFIGGIFLAVSLFLIVMLSIGLQSRGAFEGGRVIRVIAEFTSLLLFLGGGVYLFGMFLSGGSSAESGARGWSLGTRVMIVVVPLTIMLFLIVAETDRRERGLGQATTITIMFEFGGVMLCWMMYLRQLAVYVGRRGTAFSAVAHLVVSEILLLLQLVLQISDSGLLESKPFNLIINLLAIGMMIWQMTIIAGIRSGLTQFLIRSMLRRGR